VDNYRIDRSPCVPIPEFQCQAAGSKTDGQTDNYSLAASPCQVWLILPLHVARDVGLIQRGRGISPQRRAAAYAAGASGGRRCQAERAAGAAAAEHPSRDGWSRCGRVFKGTIRVSRMVAGKEETGTGTHGGRRIGDESRFRVGPKLQPAGLDTKRMLVAIVDRSIDRIGSTRSRSIGRAMFVSRRRAAQSFVYFT